MKVILLIDDDIDDHETIKQAFYAAEPGVHCLCFADCDEAIKQLSNHSIPHVDCILVDLHMPRMDGCECLKTLKELPPTMSVDIIMISSSFRDSDLDELCSQGATALWKKPNTWDGFAAMAEIIVSGRVQAGTMVSY